MAVALAQPTDVVKVRFQAQARSPGESRRYCSTIDAYKTIAKEEGVQGLWKGRLADYWGLIFLLFLTVNVTLSCRNGSKHRQKRHSELHRTGDLRFNQGHSAQVHSPDRCGNKPLTQNFDSLVPRGTITRNFCPTDNLPCHFVSAFGAGLCTTIIASPVDVVKTRYMNSSPGQYGGVLNCAASMLTKEGPRSFYKG